LKKVEIIENFEKRWEKEAKCEWDVVAQSLMPYANQEIIVGKIY
jgi:hypothetical protein